MSVASESQENYFCSHSSDTDEKCFSFPTVPCSHCHLHHCHLHLWNDLCKCCLKKIFTQEFSSSSKTSPDSLLSSLSTLETHNDRLQLEITKKKFKIKHLSESIESVESSICDQLKTQIEREIANRKKLKSTASNMKNAVNQLKDHEVIVSSGEEIKGMSSYNAEIMLLKESVQKLIVDLDSLKKELRQFVPYSFLRNFICAGCGAKVKSKFSKQILDSCNKDDSVINSVIAYKTNKTVNFIAGQGPSCNCLVF